MCRAAQPGQPSSGKEKVPDPASWLLGLSRQGTDVIKSPARALAKDAKGYNSPRQVGSKQQAQTNSGGQLW